MKTITKILVAIAVVMFVSTAMFAQSKGKFGHVSSNDLLLAMPERVVAEKAIQEEAQKLEAQLMAMSNEYQSKVSEYQASLSTMSPLIRDTKAKEIGDLEQRIQNFQMQAQEALQDKEQELLQPLIDKAKKAIAEVATENGYSYVFDSSVGVLLYMPEGDDVLPLVKKKMGIN
jgi:outer membrane protein